MGCYHQVSNKAEPTIKDSIYGALTLKVEINVPQECTFIINDDKVSQNSGVNQLVLFYPKFFF